MTFETRRRLGFCAALLLCASACDKGSVGEFGETEGEAGSATSGPISTASAGTESAGSASAGMTTLGTGSTGASSDSETATITEASSDSGELLDVGDTFACENPAHACGGPVDCGENCGVLDSMFDEDGCVRVACGAGLACDDGEFCYRPQDYGGCQSSDVSCSESNGMCECGLEPDCGGAYCVPESIVFGGIAPGPVFGLVTDDCAPDDGPAFSISVGEYASDACGGAFDPGPLLTILVSQPFGTTGTFTGADAEPVQARYSADGSPEMMENATAAIVRVTEWGGMVSGDYEVLLEDDTLLVGELELVVACSSEPMCG